MSDDRLDGGYGFVGDIVLAILLEELPPEERKKVIDDFMKEDPEAFDEFCEDHHDIIKELGIKIN